MLIPGLNWEELVTMYQVPNNLVTHLFLPVLENHINKHFIHSEDINNVKSFSVILGSTAVKKLAIDGPGFTANRMAVAFGKHYKYPKVYLS